MTLLEEDCGNCGRAGVLRSVKHVELDSREEVVRTGPGPNDYVDAEYLTMIEVLRCTQCEQPTFVQYVWLEPLFDSPEDAMGVRRIYPPRRDVSSLPDGVRKRYAAMLDVLHAPDLFAVNAGRCLEAVCADRGIPGKRENGSFVDLNERLDALVKEKHVPKVMGDQGHLVRKFRNLGGHDGDVEPGPGDVPLIRDFVEVLLEFLYWGPAKLAVGTAELKQRLAAAEAKSPS